MVKVTHHDIWSLKSMETGSRQVDLLWEAEEEMLQGLRIDSFFNALMDCLALDDVEVSILITDDQKMKTLNHRYRHKDKTTDVLSFPSKVPMTPDQTRYLGDIVISYQRAKQQAREIGHSLERELRFLGLHGVLHLLGYDHETDQGEMLRLQSQLKKQLADFF